MVVTHKISMDLTQRGAPPRLNVVQGDTNTRVIELSLYSGGIPWPVPTGAIVSMRYCKPDSTRGVYDTLPDGSTAWTAQGNVITIAMAPQMLTVPGFVYAQIALTQGADVLATFTVTADVTPDPAAGVLSSEDYVNWLEWLGEEIDRKLEEVNEALDRIYAAVSVEPVYGFIEHNAILAPGQRIEYIGINKDWNPITVTMGGGYSLGDWADFPWIKGNLPYMVRSDGTPDYRLNPDDYTLKEDGTPSDIANTEYDGGAFAWCPKIYKREYMAGDDRYVLFSMTKRDGYEPVGFIDSDNAELEGVWIPMFYGSVVDGKMRSLSGLQPDYGKATAQQKTAIDAVGSRAKFLGGAILNTLIDLELMLAKTSNLQSAYGYGNSSGYNASLAPTNGVKANSVVGGGQFFGTTDGKSLNKIFHSIVLGSYQQWIRDPYMLLVNGRYKVSENYSYDLTGATYTDTGISLPQILDDNGSQKFGAFYPHKYQTVSGFGSLPVYPYNGSTSTGGCDGLWQNCEITSITRRFGSCSSNLGAGGRYFSFSELSVFARWDVGSAVLLLPLVGVTV